MIEFTDDTLIRSHGNYQLTSKLVGERLSVWMLRTDCLVTTTQIVSRFLLHLWKDGRVVIMSCDRPPILDLPEEDIRQLHEWVQNNGWTGLHVHDDLVGDPRGFEFWMHYYRCGLVMSEILQKHEQSEMKRFEDGLSEPRRTN